MAAHSPVFCTFALLIAQLADEGSCSRDDRHRAQVHDAETQEDRHQTDIAVGAMEAEAQTAAAPQSTPSASRSGNRCRIMEFLR